MFVHATQVASFAVDRGCCPHSSIVATRRAMHGIVMLGAAAIIPIFTLA
ncbi:MAG: hypothetical protein WCH44_01505 [Betaproteobacteria bacterium]